MSQLFWGKVMLGILVVTTATGGFALGYFVGKSQSSPAASFSARQPLHEGEPVPSVPVPGSKQEGESSPVVPVVQSPPAETKVPEVRPSGTQRSPVNVETKDEKPSGQSPHKALYTVQAGAFRNQRDAAVLKHKLEAKGYKVSIRRETGAGGIVFFKVSTGEFESKKEASLVAVRLKNTDGLGAFATEKK